MSSVKISVIIKAMVRLRRRLRVTAVQLASGAVVSPTATVKLKIDDEIKESIFGYSKLPHAAYVVNLRHIVAFGIQQSHKLSYAAAALAHKKNSFVFGKKNLQ